MTRRRLNRRVTQRIFIAHRGGAAASAGSGGGVDAVCYVASVRGGRADLELSIVGGVLQALGPTPGHVLEALRYALGDLTTPNGGFGWNASGTVATPFAQLASQQTFEAGALGGVGEAGLVDGSGWVGVGTVSVPYVRLSADEAFEVYPVGGVAEGALTAGSGWNGAAALFAW